MLEGAPFPWTLLETGPQRAQPGIWWQDWCQWVLWLKYGLQSWAVCHSSGKDKVAARSCAVCGHSALITVVALARAGWILSVLLGTGIINEFNFNYGMLKVKQ